MEEKGERRTGRALADATEPAEPDPPSAEVPPPTEFPIDGTLDLHTFHPAEVRALVPEYLAACQQRNLLQVRIVHGKGTGTLRRIVESVLQRDPRVDSFRPAGEDGGGWGATLVTLRRL